MVEGEEKDKACKEASKGVRYKLRKRKTKKWKLKK